MEKGYIFYLYLWNVTDISATIGRFLLPSLFFYSLSLFLCFLGVFHFICYYFAFASHGAVWYRLLPFFKQRLLQDDEEFNEKWFCTFLRWLNPTHIKTKDMNLHEPISLGTNNYADEVRRYQLFCLSGLCINTNNWIFEYLNIIPLGKTCSKAPQWRESSQ